METQPLLLTQKSSTKKKRIIIASVTTAILAVIGAVIGITLSRQQKSSQHNTKPSRDNIAYSSLLGIKNNAPFSLSLTKSDGIDGSCVEHDKPKDCYERLKQLAEQWIGLQDNTSWLDLEYNVLDVNGAYLGHFGISFTSNAVTISNKKDIEITLGKYEVGKAQSIDIKIINNTCELTPNPTHHNKLVPGVNLSGLEWGNNPNEIVLPSCDNVKSLNQATFQVYRVPFKLEYASSDGMTINANSDYVKTYLNLVNLLTNANYKVIVEPHNYMRFNKKILTPEQCKQLIGNAFVSLFKKVKQENLILEAMNEPHDVELTTLSACYDALITTARAQGYAGPIIIEGSAWGAPSQWTNPDGSSSEQFNQLARFFSEHTTYGDVQLGIHTYFNSPTGGGDGLTECVSPQNALVINRISELTSLAKQHNIKIAVTEIGVINSNNCLGVLENALKHFNDHSDVYQLYTWWTATPDLPYWGNSAGARLVLEGETDKRYLVIKNSMSSDITKLAQQHFFTNNMLDTPNQSFAISNPENLASNNRLSSSALTLLLPALTGIAIGFVLFAFIIIAYHGGKKIHSKFFQSPDESNDIEIAPTNVPKPNL